jgi:hypothetical protein
MVDLSIEMLFSFWQWFLRYNNIFESALIILRDGLLGFNIGFDCYEIRVDIFMNEYDSFYNVFRKETLLGYFFLGVSHLK